MSESFLKFEILPRLYLSKFPDTIPSNIIHVLNMCTHPHSSDETRSYLHVPIDGIDNIKPHISAITSFIDTALQFPENKILVYCALGLNRSAAAIISYLCHTHNWNSKTALELLKEKKPDVQPSAIFQIDQYLHREVKDDDPLVGFHQRLKERKLRDLGNPEDSYRIEGEQNQS